MESTNAKKSIAFDWLMTFVSLGAVILLLAFADEWFWLALPFFLTYLVRALDSM